MFRGEEIDEVIKLLEERNAFLYHACQLVDFRSYLEVGGIPSRAHLESEGQDFTPFDTDESDRNRGVWDKVFANLSDFGSTFATGHGAVPNTYGPILFQIKPKALSRATDVAICLRSAGRKNFDRETESLSSLEDVNRLFKNQVQEQRSQYVKSKKELQEEFSERSSDISAPEISCSVEQGYLTLKYVNLVRVEPYCIQGKLLKTRVEEIKNAKDCQFRIFERDRVPSYTQELINILTQEEMSSLSDLCQNHNLSQELRNWATEVNERKLEYQFKRFAKYLRTGTIDYLKQ